MRTTRLYLLRHGEAVPDEVDPSRPLSAQGREDVARTARLLAALALPVRQIRHSGKRRARETAELVAAALRPSDGVVEAPGLAPSEPVAPLANELAAASHDLLLVGHLPHLERLAALLVTGRETPSIVEFDTAGVVGLERDPAGAWRTLFVLPPAVLAAAATIAQPLR